MTALAEHNEFLRREAAALQAGRGALVLSALELADQGRSAERLELVRAALTGGASPTEVGLTFVVTMAELAYEVDWSDQFSFWPKVSTRLACPAWDPVLPPNRPACTAAFEWFAGTYRGVRPTGRFAEAFPHMSWPLLHAVMPRAAHRRLARVLQGATGDPRLVIAADGCPDEVSLGELLKAFALADGAPTYFEGLLSDPRPLGWMAAQLLRPRTAGAPGGGAAPPLLLTRILEDLGRDRIANRAVAVARASAAAKVVEPIGRRLPLPEVMVSLEVRQGQVKANVEVEALPTEARDSRALRPLLERTAAVVHVDFGGSSTPMGLAENLLYGPLDTAVRWPDRDDGAAVSLQLRGQGNSGRAEDYFERVKTKVDLPAVFTGAKAGGGLTRAAGLPLEGEVVILVSAAVTRRLAVHLAAAGLTILPVAGTEKVIALHGTRAPGQDVAWRRVAEVVGIFYRAPAAAAAPVLVPPLHFGPGWAEWAADVDAFVSLKLRPCEGEHTTAIETSQGTVALPHAHSSAGILVRVPREVGPGRLNFVVGGQSVGTFEVRRRPRPHHRALAPRFRALLVPPRASVAHLLGDACAVELSVLPGVRLAIGIKADEVQACAELPAGGGGRLCTSEALAKLWRGVGGDQILKAESVAVTIAELDGGPVAEHSLPLSAAGGSLRFEISTHSARPVPTAEVPVVDLKRLPPPGSRQPAAPAAVAQVTEGDPGGLYVARAGDGDEAALIWIAGDDAAGRAVVEGPRPFGLAVALEASYRLRLVERAAVGPRGKEGAALILRHAITLDLRHALLAAICGPRWCSAEAAWSAEAGLEPLLRAAAPLVWVPRSWLLEELPELATGDEDLLTKVDAMCRAGVGDLLSVDDCDAARHVMTLLTRASLAPREEDERHLRWAFEYVARPRVLRILQLADGAARRGASDE